MKQLKLKKNGDWLTYYAVGIFAITAIIVVCVVKSYFDTFKELHSAAKSVSTKDVDLYAIWGQFGDYIGGTLNPIIGMATIVFLIISILFQRIELANAMIENEKTSHSTRIQRFESIFFSLLDLHHKLISSIKIDTNIAFTQGQKLQQAIKERHNILKQSVNLEGRETFNFVINMIFKDSASFQESVSTYKIIQNDHNEIFGHYFRNLFQAMKAIDDFSTDSKFTFDREKYSSILRAQLSSNELILLFLNCLDGMVDDGQFKNLVIEYKLLEHIPISKLGTQYAFTQFSNIQIEAQSLESYYKKKTIHLSAKNLSVGAFGTNKAFQ